MAIDWHDFALVQTVEYTHADAYMELPTPMTVRMLESMSIQQRSEMTAVPLAKPPQHDEAEADMDVCLYDFVFIFNRVDGRGRRLNLGINST